jgi:hypothetical protein
VSLPGQFSDLGDSGAFLFETIAKVEYWIGLLVGLEFLGTEANCRTILLSQKALEPFLSRYFYFPFTQPTPAPTVPPIIPYPPWVHGLIGIAIFLAFSGIVFICVYICRRPPPSRTPPPATSIISVVISGSNTSRASQLTQRRTPLSVTEVAPLIQHE